MFGFFAGNHLIGFIVGVALYELNRRGKLPRMR